MAAVNVMLWGFSWDPGADKTGKEYEIRHQMLTSMAAGAIKSISARENPDIIAIYGKYELNKLKASLWSTHPHVIDEATATQTVTFTEFQDNPAIVGRDSSGRGVDAFGQPVTPEQVPVQVQKQVP